VLSCTGVRGMPRTRSRRFSASKQEDFGVKGLMN
jgi:hypothetical protein